MKDLNIYMCGVGGQGIGLLAEVILRACPSAIARTMVAKGSKRL